MSDNISFATLIYFPLDSAYLFLKYERFSFEDICGFSSSSSVLSRTFIDTFEVSINIGNTNPSGPFLFLATKNLPVLACLSCAALDSENIKSATKHLLNASDIDSIVITSAFNPPLFVCEQVPLGIDNVVR